jgi:hypothetical protein
MTTAVLNAKMGSYIDPFLTPFSHGKDNCHKLSTVVKMVSLISDKKSATNSQKLVEILKDVKKELPKKEIDLEEARLTWKSANENFKKIEDFFNTVEKFKFCNNAVIIDEPNAKIVFNNFKIASCLLSYISDYLDNAIKTQEIKSKLSKTEKSYTYEDLEIILSA